MDFLNDTSASRRDEGCDVSSFAAGESENDPFLYGSEVSSSLAMNTDSLPTVQTEEERKKRSTTR